MTKNNEKWFSTTLDINKIGEKGEPVVNDTLLEINDILVKHGQEWLQYVQDMLEMMQETDPNSPEFQDKVKKNLPNHQDELSRFGTTFSKRIGELVSEIAGESYRVGYIEGRHDGEKDVIGLFENNKEDISENIEHLETAIKMSKDISQSTFEKFTKGKPVFFTKVED